MKNVVLKNISGKADEIARSAVPVGNKTSRDSSIYLPLQVPKEQFF